MRRARRRRRWIMAAIVVFVALVGGVAALLLMRDGGTPASKDVPDAVPTPATETSATLIGTVDPDNRASRLFLVGEDAAGDPSILLVPVETQVEVPSLGPRPLGDVPVEPGTTDGLLPLSVANALGVRMGDSTMLPTLDLSAMLAAVPSVDIRLRAPVTLDVPDGQTSFPEGEQTVSGKDAGRLLLLPGQGSELDDLVTAQAVLEGLMTTFSDPDVANGITGTSPGLAPLVDAASGDVYVDTLPVEPVGSGDNERFRLRESDVPAAVERAMPGAVIAPDDDRPRVEIRNGTGAVGVTSEVAGVIVPLGAEVTLTGNIPGFGVGATTVAYHRDSQRDAAQEIADTLGGVPVGHANPELGSLDVTVVIGADYTSPIAGFTEGSGPTT